MAEFCNRCADKFGIKADINILAKILMLKKGGIVFFEPCEGCGIWALKRDWEGNVFQKKYRNQPWELY